MGASEPWGMANIEPRGMFGLIYEADRLNITIVFPGLKWPPFFANYSVMVILIEK